MIDRLHPGHCCHLKAPGPVPLAGPRQSAKVGIANGKTHNESAKGPVTRQKRAAPAADAEAVRESPSLTPEESQRMNQLGLKAMLAHPVEKIEIENAKTQTMDWMTNMQAPKLVKLDEPEPNPVSSPRRNCLRHV